MHALAIALAAVLSLSQSIAGQTAPRANAEAVTLPKEIPLFPLPNVVLFPGVTRPLLIFEPRYREMVGDALKGDRIIGTVLLQPGFEKDYEGRPPIHDIGCAGEIEEYEQLPDGRYVILLRGLTAFRVVSEDQRKPYRLARVDAVPEILQDEERGALSATRERLAQLLYTVLPLGVEPPDASLDDAEFVNVTAQSLRMQEADRQQLLERNSVLARARALVDRLQPK
ncbi:MAG TPA: LON peptidase substrate-binding domain-containing protein [Vicinamibacterales bacterium]|nr:LON peptidase substrate-binding domain-containing protein [Vicinamibacterales bacterium]